MERFTIKDLNAKYPNDEACFKEIFNNRYGDLKVCPSCNKTTKFYRVKARKCYACPFCSFQLHPLTRTIFHKSDTSLKSWFHAIYLFGVSKNGISAKELERQLGVTYKTAWRMAKQIRLLFDSMNDEKLEGIVEADEMYMGGKRKKKTRVIGVVQRNGRIVAKVSKKAPSFDVNRLMHRNVKHGSKLMTDKGTVYSNLEHFYDHLSVNHSKEFVKGNVHTNTIDGFWGRFKRSVHGTFFAVSEKYLQAYLNEFSYRYSLRNLPSIFYPMLSRASMPV